MNHCTRALETLWPLVIIITGKITATNLGGLTKNWVLYQMLYIYYLSRSFQAAVTDLVVLNNKHLFPTDLKAGESKIKEQTDGLSGQSLPPVFQMAAFSLPSCILTLQRDRDSTCVIHKG